MQRKPSGSALSRPIVCCLISMNEAGVKASEFRTMRSSSNRVGYRRFWYFFRLQEVSELVSMQSEARSFSRTQLVSKV